MLFISHANPEDNEFSRWIALRLAKEGFPVWCDLTKLLGGEDFWKDIETAIRERSCKFLYVLSKTSNQKDGPLQELQTAKSVSRYEKIDDFIIPLLIDDLPHSQINIQLTRLNAISFNLNWAKGLYILLKKLEKDKIEKKPHFNPQTVNDWWKTNFGSDEVVCEVQETYLSNWFPIKSLPKKIYFHKLTDNPSAVEELIEESKYPAFIHSEFIVTFATAKDFNFEYGVFSSVRLTIE